jgi:hypothetical protein
VAINRAISDASADVQSSSPSSGGLHVRMRLPLLRDVLVASMNKGQFPIAALSLISIIVIIKMPSSDVAKLVFRMLGTAEELRVVGWIFFC